jgi:hypothetical protein
MAVVLWLVLLGGPWFCSSIVLSDTRVIDWSDNSQGQTNVPQVVAWDNNRPLEVPTDLTNIVAVAAGSRHFLALRSDGIVRAWGANEAGQTWVPYGLTFVVAIAAGDAHSLALPLPRKKKRNISTEIL